jgi:uncharacterized membrane protein
MKYGKKKMALSIFWMVLGAALIGCNMAGLVGEIWSGMGGGLLAVGGIQVYRQLKYRRNEEYREKVDIAMEDERNRFIRSKAWAWAGYLFVIIAAVGSIGLRIAGREELADMAAFGMALLVFLYWFSYMVLSRKY